MAYQGNDGCGGGGTGTTFACTDLNACSLDALGDVDTSTTPPQPGDVLVRNGAGQWVPGPAPTGPATAVQGGTTPTADTTVTGTGTAADPFVVTAEVNVSADADNQLQAGSDGGLFVPPWDCSELAACDLDSLGNVNAPSPNEGDSLVFTGGQWVPAPSGGGTGTTYVAGDGIEFTSINPGGPVTINADLSGQAGNQLSIGPDGGLFVPAPTDTTVVQGQDTASVDVTVTEGPADTFTVSADTKLSAAPGNALTINSDGLFVPAAAAGGVTDVTVTDTPTLDLTATPNADGSVTISGAPILSTDAGNQLAAGSDGALFVPPLTPGCGLDGAGTSAAPLAVATSATWGDAALPFPCDDTNGVPIYCDTNGQLRTAPDKLYVQAVASLPGAQDQAPPATGATIEVYDLELALTNPSDCREMRATFQLGTSPVEFIMSPGNYWLLQWGFTATTDGTEPPFPPLNGGNLNAYRHSPQAVGGMRISFTGYSTKLPMSIYTGQAAIPPGDTTRVRIRVAMTSFETDLTPADDGAPHWNRPDLVLFAEGWSI
ncbi:hypothetical protein [Amycolatopsis thermophila]|uniref:Uncharacterized protein n=1 Tax=Amycolatopsis thermophila TaxID=206084 RepID=A0ABU0EMI4_9PSEU|nr:hypothetical protein [Amycolatopsis thermophila]MDQ0376482.1 hypothetical protein [Amycolatopsis thermophila]